MGEPRKGEEEDVSDEPEFYDAPQWTDDCQGKKNYDGSLVRVSSRYWPRGGGYSVFDTDRPELGFRTNEEQGIRPSATSSIVVCGSDVISREFEADTQGEVQAAVETWVNEQRARIVAALAKEFDREGNRLA